MRWPVLRWKISFSGYTLTSCFKVLPLKGRGRQNRRRAKPNGAAPPGVGQPFLRLWFVSERLKYHRRPCFETAVKPSENRAGAQFAPACFLLSSRRDFPVGLTNEPKRAIMAKSYGGKEKPQPFLSVGRNRGAPLRVRRFIFEETENRGFRRLSARRIL